MKAWQRYFIMCKPDSDSEKRSNLNVLLEFLKAEVAGEERLKLARSGFEDFVPKNKIKESFHRKEDRVPTVAGLFSAKETTCLFCNGQHESRECLKARSLSLQERKGVIMKKNCCFKCLRPHHRAKVCKVFIRCRVCSKPHTELLCPEIIKQKVAKNGTISTEIVQSTMANSKNSREVALMTLCLLIKGHRNKRVRALIDREIIT